MKFQQLAQLQTLEIIILTVVSLLAPPVEADCNPPNCTGRGECDLTTDICACQDPWNGPGCGGRDTCRYTDSKDGSWLDRDCHHGRCETVNEDTGEYRCVCEEGFMQPDCALRDACKLDPDLKPYEDPTRGPCQNGGNCTAVFGGDTSTFDCSCPEGLLPPECEFEDPCLIKEGGNHSHPCTSSKRGTCTFLLDKEDRNRPIKKCECHLGYLGEACEDTDPCEFEETNKCVYKWTALAGPKEVKQGCTRVSNTEMNCTCIAPQYIGANCSELNSCKAPMKRDNNETYPPHFYPCQHNQPCRHHWPSRVTGFRCSCKGYHGFHCQFVNGEIIFLPAGSDKVVKTYNVYAGRRYTYYVVILKIEHPDNTSWQINTGDQGQLVTTYKVRHFRPISELQDEKVKVAVEELRIKKNITKEEPMYFLPFQWTYLEGNYSLSLLYKLLDMHITWYPTYQTDTIKISSTLPPGLACIPTSKLSDVSHKPETAVEYMRTTHFVISVELLYDCLVSEWLESKLTSQHDKRFHFQWRMHKLTRDFNAQWKFNDWHIEKFATNTTDHKYIEFKPHVLLEGLYWIECVAYVRHNGMDYGHSDLGFFRIVNDPPYIELVGGSHRTVDWNEDIVLDASQSTDESFPEDSDNLQFEWICRSPTCNRRKWTGPVITIRKRTFPRGSVIKILLRVKSAHAGNEASELITLAVKNQVASVVECVRNCHHDFNPGDDAVFRCHYTVNGVAGPPDHIKWSWLPENEIYAEEVEDEPYLTSVTIPRVPDVEDRFLICTATPPNIAEPIISQQEIKINQPPPQTSCRVEPTIGVYLVTPFSIECNRSITPHIPVVYSFYVEVSGDLELVDDLQDRLLFDPDTNAEVTGVYLPYGNPNSNWTLNIIVEATDSRGLSSEVFLPVVVTRPNASVNIHDLLDNLVYKNDSLMRQKIHGGNIQGGLQLQMLALFELADERFPSTIPLEKRHQLLSTIAHDLHENHPNVFKELQQIVNVVHLLVQLEDRINKKVFIELSELMMETTAKLAEDVHNPLEVTPTEDKDNIVNTTVDSGGRILKTAAELCEQAKTNVTLNIRDVTEFIEEDETRDTFAGLNANDEKFDKDNYDDVSETAEQDVKDYCNVAKHALTSLSHSADAAAADLSYDETFDTATDDVGMHAEILSRNTLGVNATLKTLNDTDKMRVEVNIPPEIIEAAVNNTDGDLELQIAELMGNPHSDDTSANPNTPLVKTDLKDPDSHNQISLVELPIPLEISFPVSRPISQMELEAGTTHFRINIVPPEELDEYSPFPRFKINLPYNAEIGIEISDVSSPSMIFRVLALKSRRPLLRDFCELKTIETDEKGYTATFKSEFIGLSEKPDEAYLEYYVGILAFDNKNPFTIQNFSIVFTRPACVRRNDDAKFWSEKGCMVKETQTSKTSPGGKSSELERITCLCNHFSLFAGVHFVIPHTIENSNPFTDFTVVDLEENPVVLITVCVLLVLYVLGFILCRYLDLRDERKSLGLTIMADLKESSWERYYLITVLTGTNLWAGTSSCVCMTMYGSNGRSQIYTLKDKDLTVFRRGAADTFLVGCNKDLGTLEKIRIWTDHTGHDPAWYCRKILIRHIATDQEWYFYINRWLTVTAEESTVVLEISATDQEERKKFFVRFQENLSDQFENAKLWISIFRYSPNSTFTRCQRLSSAFAVLSSYLMLDILAVGTVTEDENGLIEFGEYTIDFYAILKSIQLVLFALPFGIIVVGLFRNILPKNTPTLIIWKNVVPSKTEFGNKKLFIPAVHGISKPLPKRESVTVEIDGDEEGDDDFDEQDEDADAADQINRYSWIQPTVDSGNMNGDNVSISSSSTFSIPSTDIPMLEGWIEQRLQHQDSGLDSDEDYEDRFVFNLDMGSEYDESHEANKLARLGRRALTHAVREYDPDAFIFEGEHDIPTLEELIDKRILEGKRPAKQAEMQEEMNDNSENGHYNVMTPKPIVDVDVEPVKKKSKISSIFKKIGRKAKTPWKEVVTSEYLQKIDESLENELESREAVQNEEVPPEIEVALELCLLPRIRRPRFSWPWWFIFIAWFVCLSSIAGSSAFTIIFGIHYGFLRSMRWVENFLGSVFISNLVVQPLNAVAGAFLSTLCGKRQKLQETVQVVIENGDNSALLNSRKPYNFSVFRAFRTYEPLAGHQIFRLKIKARRRKELRSKLLRLILSILLLAPLIAFSYSGRFSLNYGITRNIRNLFHLNGLRDEKVQFSDQDKVYDYLENVLIHNLHPENDFSGNLLKKSGPQFLSDQQTVLIGVPRIRQHRVKSSECQEEDNLFRKCIRHQSFKKTTQDRLSYHQKWVPVPAGSERLPQSENNDCWEFHDAGKENSSKVLSLTFRGHQGQYDGGGYIVELGRNRRDSLNILKFIRRHKWMDEHTRAIFVEFTLLNPNINKFVDVVILIEQGATWFFSIKSWINPIEFIPFDELSEISDEIVWLTVSMLVIVVVLIIKMYLFIRDIFVHRKPRLFCSANIWLDLAIIVFTIVSVSLSLQRFVTANEISDLIESQRLDEYVSIQKASYWDDVQRTMFGITQALVYMKTLKLMMSTDKRFLSFALTVKLTYNYVVAFFLILTILITAFAYAGFLIFGQEIFEFSTWGESMVTLVDQILDFSFIDEFSDSHPFFGRVFSSAYGFFIVFVSFNFIVALLEIGVHEAKEVVQQRRNWLTFARYFKTILFRTFPTLDPNYKIKRAASHIKTLPPDRLHAMKQVTIDYLRSFLTQSGYYRMKEMQEHANKVLAGTGYNVVSKRHKVKSKIRVLHSHIEELREITTSYFKERLGHDMKPEELKEYANFNKAIVKLRIQKMDKKVEQLEAKIDEFVSSITSDSTEDSNRNPSAEADTDDKENESYQE